MPARLRWSSSASPIGSVRRRERAAAAPRRATSRPEQVGPEMPDDGSSSLRRRVDAARAGSRPPARRRWPARPAPGRPGDASATRAVDVPGALHLEVRVQGDVADPGQQVLAPADRLVDGPADQVDLGERRAPGSRTVVSASPAECLVEPLAVRQTVSPSGTGSSLAQGRSRSPRGVAWKPAASRAADSGDPRMCSPSARSTVSRRARRRARPAPARRPPAGCAAGRR